MNSVRNMLYFLTFLTMHYCVFVFIAASGDIEAAVDAVLQPFDEALGVRPHRVHLNHSEVKRMASHYHLCAADLHALAKHMPKWTNREGGVDRDGLYYLTTCNPDGYWDWYEIGGRWDGYIPRSRKNVIKAGTLAESPDLKRCLPCYVLTPDGEWLEHERVYVGDDWQHVRTEEMKEEEWLELVRATLKRWPDQHVVCVDIHS